MLNLHTKDNRRPQGDKGKEHQKPFPIPQLPQGRLSELSHTPGKGKAGMCFRVPPFPCHALRGWQGWNTLLTRDSSDPFPHQYIPGVLITLAKQKFRFGSTIQSLHLQRIPAQEKATPRQQRSPQQARTKEIIFSRRALGVLNHPKSWPRIPKEQTTASSENPQKNSYIFTDTPLYQLRH